MKINEWPRHGIQALWASSKEDDFIHLTSRDARNGGYYHD